MRRTKATKVLATILCQCMVLGMISMNVQATTITDNQNGNTIDSIGEGDTMGINSGTVTNNYGTVSTNAGTVTTNNGTVKYNNGTVKYNDGTVEQNSGFVTTNRGTVIQNFATVTTNNVTVETNNGTVKYTNGTVGINNGTVGINNGTVTDNYSHVGTNYRTVTNNKLNCTVVNNYGTVENNNGTVENNYGNVNGTGSVTNSYCEVFILGTNSDKITTEGVIAAPVTAPDNIKQKKYVLIKSDTVSSGTIKLTPMEGYHFVSAPTVSPDCTEVTNGSYYKYICIREAITITVDVAANTPATTQATTLNPYEIFVQTQITNIKSAKEDSTVVIESEDCNSYSYNFMKEILNKRDVTVKMVYNYKGDHYEVIIPKNEMFMLDDKIPWYGPLKLEQMFGAVKTPLIK